MKAMAALMEGMERWIELLFRKVENYPKLTFEMSDQSGEDVHRA